MNVENQVQALYLDLLKKCLTRSIFPEKYRPIRPRFGGRFNLKLPIVRLLEKLLSVLFAGRVELVRPIVFDPYQRAGGIDWPADAETMIGMKRLDNLQFCITEVLRRGVPGDLIETGVWRGGATIFMRAVLKANGCMDRTVWVADSFAGLPAPNPERYPKDTGDQFWTYSQLAIPLEEVKENFVRYGMLDGQVQFLKGWFRDTLPSAPIKQLAVLRLDGDMYESTMDALTSLYPKLSVGGYVIIDDFYNCPTTCQPAVNDYRSQHGISDPIQPIDSNAVFWQRLR